MDRNITISSDKYRGLTQDLKDSLWSVALLNAPYRTGNLRSSIKRVSFSDNKVKYIYDSQQAYYTDFLEKGIGRNKKHIGFIEFITVESMMTEIIGNAMFGKTTFKGIPVIEFKTDFARNYERKIMRELKFNTTQRINAVDRAKLSLIKSQSKKRGSNKTKYNLQKYGDKLESVVVQNLEQQLKSSRIKARDRLGGGS